MPGPRKRSTTKRARPVAIGDVAISMRAGRSDESTGEPGDALAARRRMLAEFSRMIGERQTGTSSPTPTAGDPPGAVDDPQRAIVESLPPRLRQTLKGLLRGDSEKQVARSLQLSPHTVHVYVKSLYRKFNVTSRGELLAKWVATDPSGPA